MINIHGCLSLIPRPRLSPSRCILLPPPPCAPTLVGGRFEQPLKWKAFPEYRSETLVQRSGTVMSCVMVKSRQRSSERMVGYSHAPVVDSKVDIAFSIEKVVSFLTGGKKNPSCFPSLTLL